MNTDASILVYKFSPERTGFNMDAEYTQTAINCPCIITLPYINLRLIIEDREHFLFISQIVFKLL